MVDYSLDRNASCNRNGNALLCRDVDVKTTLLLSGVCSWRLNSSVGPTVDGVMT